MCTNPRLKSIDEKCGHPSQNNVGKKYPFMTLNNVSTTRVEVDTSLQFTVRKRQ